jgi:16S rRNA (cytosine1402-N4)-methyltransferase
MKPHIPVLLNEVIEGLNLKKNYNVIDATLGGGGHSEVILEKIGPKGKLIGFDLDKNAIELAKKRLSKFKDRVIYIQDNYQNLNKYEPKFNFPIHAILLDLGLSTYQLQDKNRGFSFLDDAGLEMKYDKDEDVPSAKEIVNNFKEHELEEIFRKFGEEKLSKQIAREIVSHRNKKQITSGAELSSIVGSIYKKFYIKYSRVNPATKAFQALRIYINKEFENIENFLPQAVNILSSGGRFAVISYHSLEDRIVKNYFRQESKDCICPVEIPECRCNHKAKIKIINKNIIIPTQEEIKNNPASESAKLRIVEKI